ncbi:hypothetical protein EFA46_005095 [Halarchaeum sp. CBA1220]|uniref:DUF7093 family protein n=1 Tax=Halarchaeum sp. CBA1220 TaxID=1853682 RepID=UPI000F3A80B5|nr:hypothetical protein [Halarchaeum sp. CBA1220]QLC33601.1 hypothetical protein EFA46_005095 [Halarchaeum sp. CBA1220]
MGLKCSLLGHEYGEPETEREREERGDEVVETVRTVEYCERCGTERVVSENTEVRSIRQAPPSLGDDRDETAATADSADTTDAPGSDGGLTNAVERVAAESAADEDERDAALAETTADAESAATSDVESDATTDFDVDEEPSPAEDDAVILTDDGEEVSPERARGEWPSSNDTRAEERGEPATAEGSAAEFVTDDEDAEETEDDAVFIEGTVDAEADADDEGTATAWPEQDGDDEGFAAEPASAGGTDVSFGGGLTPEEEPERAAGDTATGAEGEGGADARSGIASAGPIDTDRRSESANTDGDALVCPECGERTAVTGSSLRAGDICPECHRGYLAEATESA